MDCAHTRRLAQAYLDRELELTAALAFEEHLATCEDCRRHQQALLRVSAALVAGLGHAPAPPALRQRIAQRLRSEAQCERPWWRRTPALVAVPATLLVALATALVAIVLQHATAAGTQRVVYHINESSDPTSALRNVANHLESAKNLKAIVVAHNNGVDFLLAGARDGKTGELFEARVAQLRARGIEFRVCGNTLTRRAIDPRQIIPEAVLVPSGVAEIARLQSEERYVYMRL